MDYPPKNKPDKSCLRKTSIKSLDKKTVSFDHVDECELSLESTSDNSIQVTARRCTNCTRRIEEQYDLGIMYSVLMAEIGSLKQERKIIRKLLLSKNIDVSKKQKRKSKKRIDNSNSIENK